MLDVGCIVKKASHRMTYPEFRGLGDGATMPPCADDQ